MEWGRVKSILIGIFCIVNIFLFVRYMQEAKTSFNIKEEVIENTVAVLANNNVTVNPDMIPRTIHDVPVFDVVNKFQAPESAAKAFWDVAQSKGLDYFNPRFVTTDESSFEYYSPENDYVQISTENEALSLARDIVSSLQLDDKMTLSSEITAGDGAFIIRFMPEHEGLRIFDSYLTIELGGGKGIKIYGYNWLGGYITGGGMSSIRSVTEILINFATTESTDGANITGIKLGYYIGSRQGEINTVTAVPVWKLETSGDEFYYYDARNGDLLR